VKRGSWLALVASALLLGGCGDQTQSATTRPQAPEGPRLQLATSQTPAWQEISAEVATVDQAQVLARIPGILTSLTVREGDSVKKGQVIGRIVDSQLPYQSGAYAAQAAAAQAQLSQALADLSRTKFLYQNGVYAKARLEQAQAAADAAEAQVRAARQQQAAVNATAGQGVVVAPTVGRVLIANVPAGSPVAPGMSLATITSGPVVLRLDLPESLAGKVHDGARVMVSGLGDSTTIGHVTKVYPSVEAGQFRADALVPGLDGSLIGRRVAARIEIGTRRALLVPSSYVVTRYGIDYVTVPAKDGAVSTVPVQTTPSVETGKVEILSGVGPGDTLIETKTP
jgi:RND family efflux transporter MFP subunit